jgi:hypothetical protein
MTPDTDDLYRLRIRRAAARVPDSGIASSGAPAFVGQVTSTGAALGVGLFAKVTPQLVTGAEAVGGAGTATAGPGSVLVYQVGPDAFMTGDYVVARSVDYRWVGDRMPVAAGLCQACFQLAGDCVYGWYCLSIKNSLGAEIPGYPREHYYGPALAGIIVGGSFCAYLLSSDTYTIEFKSLNGSATIYPTSCTDYSTRPCPLDNTFTETIDCTDVGPSRTLTLVPPCYDFKIFGVVSGCFYNQDAYDVPVDDVTVTCTGPGTITQIGGVGDLGNYLFDIQVPTPVTWPITYTVTASCPGYLDATKTWTFTSCSDPGTCSPVDSVYGCGLVLTLIDIPIHINGCTLAGGIGGGPYVDRPLSGATVTYSGGITGSCVTDADGNCTIVASSPYDGHSPITATVTHPRYDTQVYVGGGDISHTVYGGIPGGCGFIGSLDHPTLDYVCGCCPEAMPLTLDGTIAGYPFTLTMDPSRGGTYWGTWTGQLTVDVTSYSVNHFESPPGSGLGFCMLGIDPVGSTPGATSTGGVCLDIVFSCLGITFYWLGYELGGNFGVPLTGIVPIQGPCSHQCDLDAGLSLYVPQIADVASTASIVGFSSGGISFETTSDGVLECGPFLFTATSPVSFLPGTVVVNEP